MGNWESILNIIIVKSLKELIYMQLQRHQPESSANQMFKKLYFVLVHFLVYDN